MRQAKIDYMHCTLTQPDSITARYNGIEHLTKQNQTPSLSNNIAKYSCFKIAHIDVDNVITKCPVKVEYFLNCLFYSK